MSSRRTRQLGFDLRPLPRWGGRRDGAGRKPGPSPRDPHPRRPALAGRFPCHVTLKVRREIPSLRSVRFVHELERSFAAACERGRFRLAHYSIQGDHVHAIDEAASSGDLAARTKWRAGNGGRPSGGWCLPPSSRILERVIRRRATSLAAGTVCLLAASARGEAPVRSTCYGSAERGRLENGVALPASGAHFEAYSRLGVALGRTCVHSAVAEIVAAAYADLARELPSSVFVYGEASWCAGGSLRPQETHRNGTSVDFMVPVRDATGASVRLPTSDA